MGIFTFKAKKYFFFLAFLLGVSGASAQCPTVTNPLQTFCDLQSPTVANLVATNNGGGVVWYANATGGTPLSSSTGLLSGEDYFADSSAGCGNRQQVIVTVFGKPAGQSFQGPCVDNAGDATIADLEATGNNIQWYSDATGGSPLPLTTQLVDNTIYYAGQTNPNTGCETSRLAVFVNVGVVPTPSGPALQRFCNNPSSPAPTIANLVASGVNNWYPTATSAVQLPASTPLVNGQSYFATTVDPPCESTGRLEVVVELVPLNNAGTNGTRSICVNQVATTAPFNLLSLLGGSPDSTGVWTGPIATTNGSLGTLNPSAMTLTGSPYTFTYTVNNGVCAPVSSTVTITILPLPTVGMSGNATICSGGSATVFFTGTPNATVTYNTGGANQTIVLNASGNANIPGTYTSTTTFTLISIASAGTPSCSQTLTGSITINVLPLPTATIASNVSICSGTSATITFTGTPGATVTYTTGGANQTIVLNASGTATITNAYTVTTTFNLVSVASAGTPSCSRTLTGSATVTVIQPPTVTIASSTTVCQNGSATVTFTGTPNATVTYTVTGTSGNQTIVLNGSGTATITNNFATTTTYTLVSISTAGTPVCTRPVTGTVTITVLPPPTASISSNVTVCSGASATVNFTGTANATVTYNTGGANQTIVLNGSGTASITATYTSTTVFTLVSVASSGTPSCSQPLTGSITVTVVPLPVVAISANPVSVCSGATSTITFTGTPNATVTYHVGSNPNQTIVLNASGTATITGTYTATTTITLVSVTSNGTPACSQPQTGSVTITVVPPPTASISSSTTICSGQSATITFTGTPNATITYNTGGANQTIVLNASGTATLTSTYTATTTFALVSVTTSGTPSCTQPVTGTITITVRPLPTVTIASSATVCTGGSATVTFTGTPGATVTYNTGGANQTIVLNASGTATITNTYTATTTFNLVSVASSGTPSCTQPATGSVTITVVPLPVVTISSNTTICSGGSATVTFTGTPNATVTYTTGGANQTIVLNASGTATITGTYTTNTTFTLVSITSPGTPSCSAPVSGSITITVIPPPTVTISSNASVCPNGSATITFTGTPNATVTYTVSGTPGNQTIVLNASGTATITGNYSTTTIYTLVSVATTGTPVCTQPVTGTVTITVLPPPTVTIAANASVCSGQSASVTFTGTPNAVVTYNTGGANQAITLDASGTTTLTSTFTSTTTFTLVSVSTAGSPGCSQPATGSVTITVLPLPTASLSSSIDVCSGGTGTVTFTGTPNATVTYTVTGTPGNQTIVLNAAGTATITNTFTSTTTYTLVSVASAGTPSCTAPITGQMIVTVVPLPTVAISATSSTICSGTSATITFTGTPNATVVYTVTGLPGNQSFVLNGSGTATLSPTLTGTTTYTLVSVSTTGTPSCTQPQTGSVTITVTPPPVAGSDVALLTLCSTGPTVDLFPLLGSTAQAGGTWSPTLASGTGVFNPAVDPSGTYVYTVTGNAPCPGDTASVTVTVQQPADAGDDASVTICSTAPAQNLFASLGPDAQPGGTWSPALASGTGVFNPAVDPAGTYTYTVTGVAPCGSDSATITVSLIPAANAGDDGSVTFCANGPSQNLFNSLGGTPQAGGTWSPALASGTGVFNPSVDAVGTYTYTVIGNSPCANDTATVAVSITTPPNAGNDATLNICSNANAQDLFALLGSTAQSGGTWSPALASGTGLFNPAVDTSGTYIYTVNGTAPCGSDTASVTVTVTPGPDAGQNGSMTVCANSASQDLFNFLGGTPQAGGTWSPALASGTGVFNPAVDPAGVYTYTFFGNQPCDNDTATVTVTVNPVPDAGTNGTAFFCSNYPAADLFASLGGTPQAGGTWSPALASGTGVFNPLVDAPGTYTYSVGGNLCSLATATVTVSVVQSPNAGGAGQTLLLNACTTATSVDLFTALNGSQGVGTWADDDASGALTGNIFNPSLVAPGTYHFTYTVSGGVSPCTSDSATVTVIVVPVPNAGTFGSVQSVCTSVGTFDLTTLLNGEQPNGEWTDSNDVVVTNPINISGLAAGTYSYTYEIENACGTDEETVQLTILPVPALAVPNITLMTPICLGENATVNLGSMADGNYTIMYDLSGSNTATGLTATVTIASGAGTFNIPSANLTNTGTTTITFTNIANTVSGCTSALTNVQVNVVIRPTSNLDSVNLSAGNVCQGNSVTVAISGATGLANGNYQFNYNLPGGTPATGTTGIFAVNNGAGQFLIAGTSFPTAGNYTLTISGIVSLSSGCSNLTEDATVSFQILASPDVTGATVSAGTACLNFSNEVSIAGANNLTDGTYSIDYQLSGANTATGTVQVIFTNGNGNFTIPANQLTNAGTVTLTITQLSIAGNPCTAGSTLFNTVSFEVSQLGTPVLEQQGDEFCATDNPTIADLSANIQGGQTVVWYNAPSGGTAYAETDALVNGVKYYATFANGSGCESPTRLEVTVDLTVCNDIIIPDGFSPNQDGINDAFVVVNLAELYPNYRIEIYNRYGNILYKGDINTPNWDGTASQGGIKLGNGVCPVGVYFFIIEFNDGVRSPLQGRVYLSR